MKRKNEKKLIICSAFGALGFAITGILLGGIMESQMIIFDGLYSFISVGLSLVSLWAMGRVGVNQKIPVNFMGVEKKLRVDSLVVFFKYVVILIIVMGSLFGAIVALFHGGRDTAINYALLYAVVSTVVCYGVYAMLRYPSKSKKSPLLKAEAHQWLMDTWASLGVLVGFVMGVILSLIPATSFLVPYMDPIMVVIVSLYFIRVPIKEIRKTYDLIQHT